MAKRTAKLVANICLYGNQEIGFGYIAQAEHQMAGNGEPKLNRSATEAIWLAAQEVRNMGISKGTVRVFAPGGRMMADADLNNMPYYGNLEWKAAIQYEVSAEAIDAAASR